MLTMSTAELKGTHASKIVEAGADGQFKLNHRTAQRIFCTTQCADEPLSLVAAIGGARIGKSTLMEMLCHGDLAEPSGRLDTHSRDVVLRRT